MSDVADQAYLNTRVSVMATRLFPPDLAEQLIQMPLPALAERFGLTALLDEQHTTAARSRAVEQSLIWLLMTELQILIRPMKSAERGLLLAWGRKYALFNLKTLIRGKLYELDQKDIGDNLYDLPESIRLPDRALFGAENVLEMLRQLEAGPHHRIARQAREVYEQQREPFALEATVDQRYFADLAHRILTFDSHQQASLRRLIGVELDRTALLWMLRFRFSYQLSPSETFYQLVPSPRLLTRERLLNLVNLENLERILESLPEPLNQTMADCRTIADVQRRMELHTQREIRWLLARSPSGVARALAYLMLREADLMRLFAVVQGRLLGFPNDRVEMALNLIDPECATGAGQAA